MIDGCVENLWRSRINTLIDIILRWQFDIFQTKVLASLWEGLVTKISKFCWWTLCCLHPQYEGVLTLAGNFWSLLDIFGSHLRWFLLMWSEFALEDDDIELVITDDLHDGVEDMDDDKRDDPMEEWCGDDLYHDGTSNFSMLAWTRAWKLLLIFCNLFSGIWIWRIYLHWNGMKLWLQKYLNNMTSFTWLLSLDSVL